MLNKDLEVTLNLAFQQARDARHEYMTVEHLLLALTDNPAARDALLACGANIDRLKEEVANFITQTTPIISDPDDERETQPTLGFQRVLQRAVFHVQSSGRNEVTGANVLVAIFSEQESQAVYLLRRYDITRLDVVNYISHGFARTMRPMLRGRRKAWKINPKPQKSAACWLSLPVISMRWPSRAR